MGTQGDSVLKDLVDKDIARLEKAGEKSPCAHCGMLTLLKCKQAEMRGSGVGVKTAGMSTMVIGLLYAILKAHGVLP